MMEPSCFWSPPEHRVDGAQIHMHRAFPELNPEVNDRTRHVEDDGQRRQYRDGCIQVDYCCRHCGRVLESRPVPMGWEAFRDSLKA